MRPGWEGLLLFWLHRISGVGVALFLLAHILDTVLVLAGPAVYDTVMQVFAQLPFRILELLLIGAVVFHAVNGLRILLCDIWPTLYAKQRTLVWAEAAVILALFAPAAYFVMAPLL